MDKPALIIPITVLPKIASLVLVFFFVRTEADYTEAMIIQFLVSFILTAIICIAIFRKLKLVKYYQPQWREIKAALQDGWHLFLSTAAISFYTTSNIVLLGIIANNQVVGYFAAADKLIKGVQALIFTIGQAAYPRINKYVSESKEKAIAFLVNCLKWMGGAGLICSAGLLLLAELAVHIVFGAKDYEPAIAVVRILSVSPFFVALSYVFGILGLLPFGYKKSYSRIYIIVGFLSLGITIPLAYFFNMHGVAFSVIFTEVVIAAIMLRLLQKKGILVAHHLHSLLTKKN
jgi:O-antigen/teichoic acid export membrane protein